MIERWMLHLANALSKNPRAAFSIGAVIVILFLTGTAKGLFADNTRITERERDELKQEVKDLKGENKDLEAENDALRDTIGKVKDDCSRDKLAEAEKSYAKLQAFNDALLQSKATVERKLQLQEKISNQNQNLAKKLTGH